MLVHSLTGQIKRHFLVIGCDFHNLHLTDDIGKSIRITVQRNTLCLFSWRIGVQAILTRHDQILLLMLSLSKAELCVGRAERPLLLLAS